MLNESVNAEPYNSAWQPILPFHPIPPETRPRVLAYARKERTDFSVTLRSDIANDLDLQVLEIRQSNFPVTFIVNLYNELDKETNTRTCQRLRSLTLPVDAPVILTGDWNLHHPLWEPSRDITPTREAEEMVEWLHDHGFTIMNQPDVPTWHSHGGESFSTLDLTFINHPADDADTVRDWAIDDDWTSGSDHSAIKWIIDYGTKPIEDTGRKTWVWKHAEKDAFLDAVKTTRVSRQGPLEAIKGDQPSEDELDRAAHAIREILTEAADSTVPIRRPSYRSKPWWTEELTELRDQTIFARRRCREHTHQFRVPNPTLVAELKHAEHVFTRTFKKTKNQFYRNKLAGANKKTVFEYRRWTQGKREYPSPPISRPGRPPAIHHRDKCKALREELFPPPADLPHHQTPNLDMPRESSLPEEPVTKQEVFDAIFDMDPNKAPGPDGLPLLAIQWAWEAIADDLFFLFSRCAQAGYHPTDWHESIAIALKKPNKPDYSNPRAYRLIQLLNTLGKVLEKLMARRLSFLACKHGMIPDSQFGAMPGKSTVDAILTFTHDVESARERGMATSALTFDITGAFDFVSHPALLKILHQKAIPTSIIRWVGSFLGNRKSAISLDGRIEEMSDIRTGIPQGSPVSPVLFLFASSGLEEYVRQGFPDHMVPTQDFATRPSTIFFVDDGKIYVSSFSLERNIELLQEAYRRAQEFLGLQGMRIDQAKRELMHYYWNHRLFKGKNPEIKLPGPTLDTPPSTVKAGAVVKWLGIYLDPRLSFKAHTSAMKEKAQKALGKLRRLANTQGGLHQSMCRRLYIACVLPIIMYASPVWFKGEDVYGTKTQVLQLERVQRQAMRWICGAFRTTPVTALHVETAIWPLAKRMKQISARFASRLNRMDAQHPIRQRLPPNWRKEEPTSHPEPPVPIRERQPRRDGSSHKPPTRLRALASLGNPDGERIYPFLQPPWRRSLLDPDLQNRITIFRARPGQTKAAAARQHRKRAQKLNADPTHALIYTDGSLRPVRGANTAGAGVAVYCHGDVVKERSVGLGHEMEVYDAELYGLQLGASTAVELALATARDDCPTIRHLHFFSDNDSAVGRVTEQSCKKGQSLAEAFWRSMLTFLDSDPSHTIEVSWVPGHQDVDGNERVDAAAKKGTESTPTPIPCSITHSHRKIDEQIRQEILDDWNTLPRSGGYQYANRLPPRPYPYPHFSELPRRIYSVLTQVRTGHCFLGEYYLRRVPSESPSCTCGHRLETREHVFTECPKYRRERDILRRASPALLMTELLGTQKGIEAVAKFIRATGAFTKSGREAWRQALEEDAAALPAPTATVTVLH